MASSTDVATVRAQAYLNMPLVQRCRELTMLIEESSTTELQHVFLILIDSLFGIHDNFGWGLHAITLRANPQEFETLRYFLGPQGPIFSLCYKLLPDCYLKYNFPVSYLPAKIRCMLEDGMIPPFYLDKIREEQNTRQPTALSMNPFEYYVFHFAYHLTNPWLQLQHEHVRTNWQTVYVQLAHDYLYHFLPRDNSQVLPIIGPYVKKLPTRKVIQSPESKRLQTPRLLRTSILSSSGSTSPTSVGPQQQCLPQVWRSETIIHVFLDFWLEYTEETPLQLSTTVVNTIPRRHSIHSDEHIRLVRLFIKTLHEFSNSAVGDRSAMDELKRIILPSVQGKIYTFLRKAIYHWPLDSSFRLILEAWLSFIQPWRYIPGVTYTREGKSEEEERGKIHDPSRWISFIANNLLAYTAIFRQLLPRFVRTDLVAPKNALMLFRVTKVFSQPHLAKIIAEVESCIEDIGLSRSKVSNHNQWVSIVRQHILELEGPMYQYTPMFSQIVGSEITFFLGKIKQAHLTASSLVEALEEKRKNRKFFLSLWEFFTGEENSEDDISLEERQKVPTYLAYAQQQLIDIFQIDIVDIHVAIVDDQEYNESILSNSRTQQSHMDSSLDSSRPGVLLSSPINRQVSTYVEYNGDPELQPVRSDENGFLVRILYNICLQFNTKYQDEIRSIYNRTDFLGRVARQVLRAPTTLVEKSKRTTEGFKKRCERHLPPRLSLRRLASHKFLGTMFFGMLVSWTVGYGIYTFIFSTIFVWVMSVLIRAAYEPWIRSDITAQVRPNVSTFSIN